MATLPYRTDAICQWCGARVLFLAGRWGLWIGGSLYCNQHTDCAEPFHHPSPKDVARLREVTNGWGSR